MKAKENRLKQALIQIDSCRKRIELLQQRIDEENNYMVFLRTKYEDVLKKEPEA